ncbi:hypothetical protein WICPIJ_009848 [Wickerhamomyces pijperi]|uniref:Uncharacterized protein n=1 Tax=Wickerhamomyces pijperi TaxID=599730 RepID=A0A9P8PL10_WICPI|nr:hypothetical protein WICPIJ_009848 [Wickerhamomyces pijperi]
MSSSSTPFNLILTCSPHKAVSTSLSVSFTQVLHLTGDWKHERSIDESVQVLHVVQVFQERLVLVPWADLGRDTVFQTFTGETGNWHKLDIVLNVVTNGLQSVFSGLTTLFETGFVFTLSGRDDQTTNIGLGGTTNHFRNVHLVTWSIQDGVTSLFSFKVGLTDFNGLTVVSFFLVGIHDPGQVPTLSTGVLGFSFVLLNNDRDVVLTTVHIVDNFFVNLVFLISLNGIRDDLNWSRRLWSWSWGQRWSGAHWGGNRSRDWFSLSFNLWFFNNSSWGGSWGVVVIVVVPLVVVVVVIATIVVVVVVVIVVATTIVVVATVVVVALVVVALVVVVVVALVVAVVVEALIVVVVVVVALVVSLVVSLVVLLRLALALRLARLERLGGVEVVLTSWLLLTIVQGLVLEILLEVLWIVALLFRHIDLSLLTAKVNNSPFNNSYNSASSSVSSSLC